MKFICENGCNPKYGLLDGYIIAERLLEGVMFRCTLPPTKNSTWIVNVDDAYKHYFKQFNAEYFYGECKKYCEDNDVWECPECGCNVYVENEMSS